MLLNLQSENPNNLLSCDPVGLVQSHFGPLARNETKTDEKWILSAPGKWEKNGQKMGKSVENPIFDPSLTFRPFFSHFPGGPKIHFSDIFFPFRASGPKWVCTSPTGSQTSRGKKNNSLLQDKFDHDKGQKSAISGRRLHWRLSTGFFCFFLQYFMCNLVRRAPYNLEKVAKNPVEKIASNPVMSVVRIPVSP